MFDDFRCPKCGEPVQAHCPKMHWTGSINDCGIDRFNSNNLCERALAFHGVQKQLNHCAEESAEFILALAKVQRFELLDRPMSKRFCDLVEETADLTIMMAQARIALGRERVDRVIEMKMQRLSEELDHEIEKINPH
jgi:phosphoribosyl-ATP pyrophosphohydrolase